MPKKSEYPESNVSLLKLDWLHDLAVVLSCRCGWMLPYQIGEELYTAKYGGYLVDLRLTEENKTEISKHADQPEQ